MWSSSTYDHSFQRTRDPVRSPIDKLESDRLVVGWVTTSESLLLYVLLYFLSFFIVLWHRMKVVHCGRWNSTGAPSVGTAGTDADFARHYSDELWALKNQM
jgi:hypothetical protein